MNRIAVGVTMALVLLAPTVGDAQDRASELEARQNARLEEHLRRRGDQPGLGWSWGTPCLPPGPAVPGAHGPRRSALPSSGCWQPFLPPRWYGVQVPNPYADWAALWGRGWLDGAAIPPYHRFQYRFFPETLPDPTREGYILPPAHPVTPWASTPVAPDTGARSACARVELELDDGEAEVVSVALPVLGAVTAEALGAVIRDRLGRGAGITLRALDGYVYSLPAPEVIRRLVVSDC